MLYGVKVPRKHLKGTRAEFCGEYGHSGAEGQDGQKKNRDRFVSGGKQCYNVQERTYVQENHSHLPGDRVGKNDILESFNSFPGCLFLCHDLRGALFGHPLILHEARWKHGRQFYRAWKNCGRFLQCVEKLTELESGADGEQQQRTDGTEGHF